MRVSLDCPKRTCSALKRSYRDRLRAVAASLKIVYLEISHEESKARVAARPAHLFPASLVDNQFQVLEPPTGEAGVLRIDATQTVQVQCEAVLRWLDHPISVGEPLAIRPQEL